MCYSPWGSKSWTQLNNSHGGEGRIGGGSHSALLSQVVVFYYLCSLGLCGFESPLQWVASLETVQAGWSVCIFPVILSITLLAGIPLCPNVSLENRAGHVSWSVHGRSVRSGPETLSFCPISSISILFWEVDRTRKMINASALALWISFSHW